MNIITKTLKRAVRFIVYGYRCSSKTYLDHLRKKGMRIGEGTQLFSSDTVNIDEQKPQMVTIGKNVQITGGGYYTDPRLRLGGHEGNLRRCFRFRQTCYDRG